MRWIEKDCRIDDAGAAGPDRLAIRWSMVGNSEILRLVRRAIERLPPGALLMQDFLQRISRRKLQRLRDVVSCGG